MTSEQLRRMEECFWPRGERRDIWLILDAARDPKVFRMLLACHLDYACLYSGALPPELEVAAPYLVQLTYDYRDSRRFLQEAWGNQWGVFLRSDTSLEKLRRHLRRFLVVRDPSGNRLMFRYYDPRVLRVYLPTCNEDELNRVFGPIECFWTEGKNTENMLEFRVRHRRLMQQTFSLSSDNVIQKRHLESQGDEEKRAEISPWHGLLPIRQAQMAAFSQVEIQKFENWMCSHLRKFFPQQSQSFQESQLRELIQYGIARAAQHNITSERDVCKFIDLMIVFGRDFDSAPQHSWATTILANRQELRPKMEILYEAAGKQLGMR